MLILHKLNLHSKYFHDQRYHFSKRSHYLITVTRYYEFKLKARPEDQKSAWFDASTCFLNSDNKMLSETKFQE